LGTSGVVTRLAADFVLRPFAREAEGRLGDFGGRAIRLISPWFRHILCGQNGSPF
jgi:hypothetical protein